MAFEHQKKNDKHYANGIYQGQKEVLPIGDFYYTVGKGNHVGIAITDDNTFDVNLFFDPTELVGDKKPIDRIGHIQVGEFLINDIPTSVTHHSCENYFLHDIPPGEMTFVRPDSSFRWLNVPASYDSPCRETPTPEYANWALTVQPKVSPSDLHFYPQSFGGYTRHNVSDRKDNEFLCAFMNMELNLNLGCLPCLQDKYSYLACLNLATLDLQRIGDSKMTPEMIINAFKTFGIPDLYQNTLITTTVYPHYRYNCISYFDLTLKEFRFGALAQFIDDKDKDKDGFYFSFFDNQKLMEEYEREKQYLGTPDMDSIFRNMKFMSDVPKYFKMSYRYYTYPCAIEDGNDMYQITLFDGIELILSREYSGTPPSWQQIKHSVKDLNESQKTAFIQTLKYFVEDRHPKLVIKNQQPRPPLIPWHT